MDRRDLILAALAAGGQAGSFRPVQVQKLLFLIDREIPSLVDGPYFNFQPYDYGPFDSAVYSELEALAENGLAVIARGHYRSYFLTGAGFELGQEHLEKMAPEARDFLQQAAKWVKSLSFAQIVAAIYKAYPDMKENSVFR